MTAAFLPGGFSATCRISARSDLSAVGGSSATELTASSNTGTAVSRRDT